MGQKVVARGVLLITTAERFRKSHKKSGAIATFFKYSCEPIPE